MKKNGYVLTLPVLLSKSAKIYLRRGRGVGDNFLIEFVGESADTFVVYSSIAMAMYS